MTETQGSTRVKGAGGVRQGKNGKPPVKTYRDESWSQRWAQTVDDCRICGQPVFRRPAVKHWIHGATQLRYSHLTKPHLAFPASMVPAAEDQQPA